MKSGRYSKAVESLNRALVFDPGNAGAKTALEEARRKLGQQKKSRGRAFIPERSRGDPGGKHQARDRFLAKRR